GAAGARSPGRLRGVDARRPPPSPSLHRTPGRQGGEGSGARGAVVSTVEITHPDKLLFADDGITKADLADYYERVCEWMLPHIRFRPISRQAFPRGIAATGV